MAGGPIFPHSAFPATSGKIWPGFHVGDGANANKSEGFQVMASLDADATLMLEFAMPPALPTGTGKVRFILTADAVTGVAKINPKWASVAIGEDPSAATLTAETVQTVTWSTNDDDEYQELEVTLDADTLVAGEVVVMHVVFETASWTLAAVLTVQAMIHWE